MIHSELPFVKAILLLGGSGQRFGSPIPKQFHPLLGQPLYLYPLKRLIASALFQQILLVCHVQWMARVKAEVQEIFPEQVIEVVAGGASRQSSAYHGLQACGPDTDVVVIHDAARPFVSEQILQRNVEAAKTWGAVNTCLPSADTIVHSLDGNWIAHIPNRAECLLGQTPQSFSWPLILKAHEAARSEGVDGAVDDCSLVVRHNQPVYIVRGEESNFKITTPFDLWLASHMASTHPFRE